MKKVFSLITALALFLQVINAQQVVSLQSAPVVTLNGSVGSSVTLGFQFAVPLNAEVSGYSSLFTMDVALSTATGCTVSATNPAGITKNLIIDVPPMTPVGTNISVHVVINYTGTTVAAGSYSTDIILTVTARLAAELLEINAKSAQGKNTLTWSTASEKDNNNFVVERSVNGVDFASIGEVKAAGTSQTINNYAFLDENVTGSVNYYRIQTVDITGKMNASKVVAVASKGTLAVNVSRSLGDSKLNIVSDSEGQATVNIFNLSGQIVATQVVSLTSGASEHALNFNQTGLFIVNVTNGKSTVSTKMFR
jgi:hypothetical protein